MSHMPDVKKDNNLTVYSSCERQVNYNNTKSTGFQHDFYVLCRAIEVKMTMSSAERATGLIYIRIWLDSNGND